MFSLYRFIPMLNSLASLGHFERRISFGYDADLARVRAEFDGEHLRVIVPRKQIPLSLFGYSTTD